MPSTADMASSGEPGLHPDGTTSPSSSSHFSFNFEPVPWDDLSDDDYVNDYDRGIVVVDSENDERLWPVMLRSDATYQSDEAISPTARYPTRNAISKEVRSDNSRTNCPPQQKRSNLNFSRRWMSDWHRPWRVAGESTQ